ncbi:hypothetical protein PINS_up006854 [Pythium insidiosum]|nr:hypothetical protein PINS_up006854 [Pythium insidiosum]
MRRPTPWPATTVTALLAVCVAVACTLAAAATSPFAVKTNPLTISDDLYDPYDQRAPPSQLPNNRPPFPTGAWWTNLVLDKGDTTVVAFPYALRVARRQAPRVVSVPRGDADEHSKRLRRRDRARRYLPQTDGQVEPRSHCFRCVQRYG